MYGLLRVPELIAAVVVILVVVVVVSAGRIRWWVGNYRNCRGRAQARGRDGGIVDRLYGNIESDYSR